MSPVRICPNGHRYVKSSDCPLCPQCEQLNVPKSEWLANLSAPARRALEQAGVHTLGDLAERSELELLALHGFGPATLPILLKELRYVGLQFAKPTKSMRDLPAKPTNTDEYLKQLPTDQQKALQALRKQILAVAPDCTEHFGYGLPGFKYNDHSMLYLGAAKEHVALYGSVPTGFKERLKGFTVSKGTIQFTPEKPLPAALVKDIVKMKVAEIEMRWPVGAKKSATKKTTAKKAVAKKAAKKG